MDERIMLEPAISWVDAQGKQPIFMSLITVSTHDPYLAPGMEPTGIPAVDHAEALRWSDAFLGDFLSALEDRGRLENALVIVVSDHGEGLGKGNRRFHDAVPFEEGVGIPLLLWGPGLGIAPGRDTALRSQLDVLPTVLDLVGQWSGNLPGRSLLGSSGHEVVFSSCWYSDYCMTMRQGSDSWIYWYGRRATQLFDLDQDPDQERDLALSVPAARVRTAEDALLGWRLSVEDWWETEARP
jgi:arylsulfatase A-like enzyme